MTCQVIIDMTHKELSMIEEISQREGKSISKYLLDLYHKSQSIPEISPIPSSCELITPSVVSTKQEPNIESVQAKKTRKKI